jgi:hypothetical protein
MTARGRRWFDHLPAVTAEVACGDKRHRITWRRAKLVLEDHDLLAERSLVALGGEPPRCLQILDAWRQPVLAPDMLDRLLLDSRAMDPEEFLFRKLRYERAVESAMGGFPFVLPRAVWSRVRAAMRQRTERQFEREQRLWKSTLIESLPPELRRRRALAGIVHLARSASGADDRYRPLQLPEFMLRSVAAPLLERSVRNWRRNLKPFASVLVEARLPAPGEQAACTARIDNSGAYAMLTLPLTWFTEVWAHGIALVDDCFVLQRVTGEGDQSCAHVTAVRFERTNRDLSSAVQAPAIVTRDANGAWSLSWL